MPCHADGREPGHADRPIRGGMNDNANRPITAPYRRVRARACTTARSHSVATDVIWASATRPSPADAPADDDAEDLCLILARWLAGEITQLARVAAYELTAPAKTRHGPPCGAYFVPTPMRS